MEKIIMASDLSGFSLKEAVKKHLQDMGWEIDDQGTIDPAEPYTYFQAAEKAARQISEGKFSRGILICGTGMGMAIVANKFPGVYAAVCENTYAAEKARAINNANVLTMGGWITGETVGCAIADKFLATQFTQDLEEWRAKNLMLAQEKIKELEQDLYH